MKKTFALITGLLLITGTAHADRATDDAIKFRKAAFSLMRAEYGIMKNMLDGRTPYEKEAFAARANTLQVLATVPWEFFIAGSHGDDTSAKPEIWTKAAAHKKEIDNFQAATVKLALAAKSGDMSAIKREFDVAGEACVTCHNEFKYK